MPVGYGYKSTNTIQMIFLNPLFYNDFSSKALELLK
jgi:hypothetical protein